MNWPEEEISEMSRHSRYWVMIARRVANEEITIEQGIMSIHRQWPKEGGEQLSFEFDEKVNFDILANILS